MKFTASTLALLSVAHAASIPSVSRRQEVQAEVQIINNNPIPVNELFANAPISAAQLSALAPIRINPLLVPAYGVSKGIKVAGGSADCQGANGTPIPCFCPPNPLDFLQKLDFAINQNGSNILGTSVKFSNDINDRSAQAEKDRATACIVVLQNFNGSFGVGCPAASAPDFLSQQLTGSVNSATVRDLIVAGVQ